MPIDSTFLFNNPNEVNDSIVLNKDTISITSKITTPLFQKKIDPDFSNIEIEKTNSDWQSGIFLLAILLLACTNFLFRKRFKQLINAFIGRNYANQLMREGNLFKDQISVFLSLVYFISIPSFYLIGTKTIFPDSIIQLNLTFFLYSLIIVSGLWLTKGLIIKFTSVLFNTKKASYEIITHLLIFNLSSGIILLPAIILFYYSEAIYFLYINIALWTIINILRFFRLATVGFSYSIFSTLHLFLYLCTLEIIPTLLLVKLLMIKAG